MEVSKQPNYFYQDSKTIAILVHCACGKQAHCNHGLKSVHLKCPSPMTKTADLFVPMSPQQHGCTPWPHTGQLAVTPDLSVQGVILLASFPVGMSHSSRGLVATGGTGNALHMHRQCYLCVTKALRMSNWSLRQTSYSCRRLPL
jgi:hypothetical protein